MANIGCEWDVIFIYEYYVKIFSGYDYVVMFLGSCVYYVCKYYDIIE